MLITLDKENSFVKEDGTYDLESALCYTGIKAAWCYKGGKTTQETIRACSKEENIVRGAKTFISDHGTPGEHAIVNLEIIGLSKLMCMILNDEHQYTTCERSLRYTKVKVGYGVTEQEVELYDKWYEISKDLFEKNHMEAFLLNAKDETDAKIQIGKIAQETARYMVSVKISSSIAYSAPWYQMQKIAIFLKELIDHPVNELEKLVRDEAQEIVDALVEKNVVLTTEKALAIIPELKNEIKDSRTWLYKNNKQIKLSLFAENNEFSGIDLPNEFGASINYNTKLSFPCVAQLQRHRTIDVEIRVPKKFKIFIPPIILENNLENEWINDLNLVAKDFPNGQLVDVNINGSLKNIMSFVAKERACTKSQQEIEDFFVNRFLPDIIEGLDDKVYHTFKEKLQKCQNKCRCAYPNFTCPSPCKKPITKRVF